MARKEAEEIITAYEAGKSVTMGDLARVLHLFPDRELANQVWTEIVEPSQVAFWRKWDNTRRKHYEAVATRPWGTREAPGRRRLLRGGRALRAGCPARVPARPGPVGGFRKTARVSPARKVREPPPELQRRHPGHRSHGGGRAAHRGADQGWSDVGRANRHSRLWSGRQRRCQRPRDHVSKRGWFITG